MGSGYALTSGSASAAQMKAAKRVFASETMVPPPLNRRITGTPRARTSDPCSISAGLPEMPSTIDWAAACAAASPGSSPAAGMSQALVMNQLRASARNSPSSICSILSTGVLRSRSHRARGFAIGRSAGDRSARRAPSKRTPRRSAGRIIRFVSDRDKGRRTPSHLRQFPNGLRRCRWEVPG
eukprot:scaffold12572_cov108-Isochrysis_galbana.AAC.4